MKESIKNFLTKRRKILVGLLIGLTLTVGFFVYLQKRNEQSLSPEDLDRYESVYHEFSVTFLRKALDAYKANDLSTACILPPAIEKGSGKEYGLENMTSGLDAFDKDYYKSKFIVFTFEDSEIVDEGKDIQIVFVDRQDRIFYALVGRNPEGEICLMGFNSRDDLEPKKLKETFKSLEPYFSDPTLAI